jgi:hypothetical protein
MSAIFDKVVTVSLQDFDARQAAAPRLPMSNFRRLNMENHRWHSWKQRRAVCRLPDRSALHRTLIASAGILVAEPAEPIGRSATGGMVRQNLRKQSSHGFHLSLI